MSITTPTARNSSRTDRPFNPGQRRRGGFARAAVHMAFGRNAKALDQVNFEDRKPLQMPMRSPTARFK